MKILLVTPHAGTTKQLAGICNRAYGDLPTYELHTAASLGDVLVDLQTFKPRVALIDISMPDVRQFGPVLKTTGALMVGIAHSKDDHLFGEDAMHVSARLGATLFLALHKLANDETILSRVVNYQLVRRSVASENKEVLCD